jgi:hypothetical protein
VGAFRQRSMAKAGFALAVAFVLAFQMLLAGAVAASMAAPANAAFDAVLCVNGHDASAGDLDQKPAAAHERCDICVSAAATGLVPVVGSIAIVVPVLVPVGAELHPLALVDEQHLPRTSQGPPQTA